MNKKEIIQVLESKSEWDHDHQCDVITDHDFDDIAEGIISLLAKQFEDKTVYIVQEDKVNSVLSVIMRQFSQDQKVQLRDKLTART